MRLAIVGSRIYPNPGQVAEFVMCLPRETVVISGAAPGVDSWALHVADAIGLKWEAYPADWEQYGRAAGPIRNRTMVSRMDEGHVFWDHRSPGTRDFLKQATKAGKYVCVAPRYDAVFYEGVAAMNEAR
jgi:hypothetical protein